MTHLEQMTTPELRSKREEIGNELLHKKLSPYERADLRRRIVEINAELKRRES